MGFNWKKKDKFITVESLDFASFYQEINRKQKKL